MEGFARMSGLLETKLHRPTPLPKPVPRPRLIQRLNDGLASGRRLTLVSAPAGFGKTACLSQWLDSLDLPIAWLSLDPADDDPGRFFTYLIAALHQVHPELALDVEGVLRSGQIPPAEVISTTLVNELLQLPQPFLLVLDDFQVLQDRSILQMVEQLVANLPPALHLVLITREDPSLPLARLRAGNQLTELRLADLRFTAGEAACFLNDSMGLGLAGTDVAALEERTEGWIAGLQLAALALQALPAPSPEILRPERSAFIANLSGSHRFILSYLTEEVLNRQPAETRRFLLQTAILDRLSGDLCDALTGRTGSRFSLESLYNANLFLVPLDDQGRWYRYHHLFAGLLRDLQHALHKDETAGLHRRASQWFAQAAAAGDCPPGDYLVFAAEAVRHALAAADYPLVVALLESHALALLIQGHDKTVAGWLQAIPLEWAAQSPRTNLAFAWRHLLRGDFAQAAPYVQRLQAIFSRDVVGAGFVRAGLKPAPTDASLEAEWLALQSMLLNMQGQPQASLELANRALALVPEEDGYVRSLIYMGLAGAYQQLDDYPNAVQSFQMLILQGRVGGSLISEMLGVSALLQMALKHGQLHFAYDLAAETQERLERLGTLSPICAAVYGALGYINYQWYQLDQAHSYLQRTNQLSALGGYSDAEISYALTRSRLRQVDGDLAAATRELQVALDLLQRLPPAWVREEVISQQVRLALAQDQPLLAEQVLQAQGFGAQGEFSVPELASTQQITPPLALLYNGALRLLLYRAQALHQPEWLPTAIELAGRLLAEELQGGYLPVALETLLLRAQLLGASGDAQCSLADYARALELAAPEGPISFFIDEGRLVATALATLLEQDRLGDVQSSEVRLSPAQARFARDILSAFPFTQPPETPQRGQQALLAPLSGRELEVLRLMADGQKYDEIARNLVVSLNTVRSHVKAIYGKLNVNNRTQAIEMARQIQLI
jgi:LuxR family transcriptional regulator, maltose regulon positive regulatory protein